MKRVLFAASMAFALSGGVATAATIDFSTNNGAALTHGSFVNGAFDFGNGITGTISTTGGSGTAQVFDTLQTNTEDPDLEFPNDDLGNVLIINEARSRVDDNARGGTITFLFDTIVAFTGVTLVDFEPRGRGFQPMVVTGDGYDSGVQFNGDNEFSQLTPSSTVFTRSLTFAFGGSGAIDNLELTAVPLPASALLLLGGLGGLAAMRRRRKT